MIDTQDRNGTMQETELIDNRSSMNGGGFIESHTRGEIDTQISTARRFPRSVKRFQSRAMEIATLDIQTAESCFYSLPRGGKNIEGPSARLSEIVLSAWTNVRSQAHVVDIDDSFVTVQGVCWDLENNVAISTEVKRRITDKYGKRFSDDMIVVTANAACSIALRNAAFKVIPMALVRPVYLAARKVAIGDASTLADRRASMLAYFGKMGVRPEQICEKVAKPGIEDINLDDLALLIGISTAIKEGDTSVDEEFPPPVKQLAEKKSKGDQLADDLGKPADAPKEQTTKKPAKAKALIEDPVAILDEIAATTSLDDLSAIGRRVDELRSKGVINHDEKAGLKQAINDRVKDIDGE